MARAKVQIVVVCSFCSKVRNGSAWSAMAIPESAGLCSFSHGYCPDCFHLHIVPQLKEIGAMIPVAT